MSADRDFEHPVSTPGQPTTTTLAELLNVKSNDQISEQLRSDLEEVRAAEFRAERESAEVRLY